MRNTTRNLQFNESEFLGSPSTPGQFHYIETADGYTWGEMSAAINAMWPFNSADYTGQAAINPYYAGALVTTPDPKVVKVTANYKAQNMKFYANEGGLPSSDPGAVPLDRYFVTDQWGNRYIMHASGQLDQSEVGSRLRCCCSTGWMEQRNPSTRGGSHYFAGDIIKRPLSLPRFPGQCRQHLSSDCLGRGRDQPSNPSYWHAHWGGGTDDMLRIREEHDSLIHGGGGVDTVVLDGLFYNWTVENIFGEGALVELSWLDRYVTLYDISYLKFDDTTIAVSAIPEPAVAAGLLGLTTGCLLVLRACVRRRSTGA